ncbi:MAG: LytR C-terminal domain-containing protein [Rhodothermales bacterium]|nr:LytR C-terminal domain-containing protein [Rhodothermales bacterium]
MASRFGNLFLNVGLALAAVIAVVLLYALIDGAGSGRPDPRRQANPDSLLGRIIQVEVLNGCNVSGVAGDMTQHLRDLGFDVVYTGNHTRQDLQETVVIDRTGNMDAAREVAEALGLSEDRVKSEVDADLYLDATVILGLDYRSVEPFIRAAEGD